MQGLVTIIGGSGFVGRYVVQQLAAAGARVRVAVRRPQAAMFLKPLGQVGQIQLVQTDIRDERQLAAAFHGADAGVNLVGILAEGGGRTFGALQAEGAGTAARIAAGVGARAFVQVSAIGADPASPSTYACTKAEGEEAVRREFPSATILRPSLIFGAEDGFTNRFAALARSAPVMPVVEGDTRFQPVHVLDVARAVVASLQQPERYGGAVFELGGPTVYTMREMLAWIMREIRVEKPLVEVPTRIARLIARAGDVLPGLPITSDQLKLLAHDNVVGAGVPGLEAFGIEPTPMGAVAPQWLQRYRRYGRFNDTPGSVTTA